MNAPAWLAGATVKHIEKATGLLTTPDAFCSSEWVGMRERVRENRRKLDDASLVIIIIIYKIFITVFIFFLFKMLIPFPKWLSEQTHQSQGATQRY